MALLFEKPSLRTRVSFEAGMTHLGGRSLMLGDDVGFGKRESIADFARVLSEMVDVIVVRAKRHDTVEDVAAHSACSVINGLTDQAHPVPGAGRPVHAARACRAARRAPSWPRSATPTTWPAAWPKAAALLGVEFAVATPHGLRVRRRRFSKRLQAKSPELERHVHATIRPRRSAAPRPCTPTSGPAWARKPKQDQRRRDFADYQVNAAADERAPGAAARFMHCLPAQRGEEVTDEVIDGPHSIVVEQAANRMHVQKGILAWLLGTQS